MIADLLTRIRNAQAVGKDTVKLRFSEFDFALLKLLEENDYIHSAMKKGRGTKRYLEARLGYKDGAGANHEILQVSQPGRKVYIKWEEIRPYKRGFGIMVVSTPRGLKIDKDARKLRVGGEIICKVW